MKRREFLMASGAAGAAAMTGGLAFGQAAGVSGLNRKLRFALVGCGIRGPGMWAETVVRDFGDKMELVGYADTNPGRVELAASRYNGTVPTYTSNREMLAAVKPDLLMVTTKDSEHHDQIVEGLEAGCNVLTEKPMTIDEERARIIVEAERRSNKRVIVAFNYRFGHLYTEIKRALLQDRIGKVELVDLNWYLNTSHGSSYYRRWHGERSGGGTLLVHKSTHHFDLMNWWLESDPVEVNAWGDLSFYGEKNSPFNHTHCRPCPHKGECKYFWDITRDRGAMRLYVDNEHHDGYLRDGCVYRPEVDIFDRHSLQIRYANGVIVNYTLTTHSPFEGFRVAFNGRDGRVDASDGVSFEPGEQGGLDQESLHKIEMSQDLSDLQFDENRYNEIIVMENFKRGAEGMDRIRVPKARGGHYGGDLRMKKSLFGTPEIPDPYGRRAGVRDGMMSILIGIAATKSIDEKRTVKISELTDLVPQAQRVVDPGVNVYQV